MIAFYKSLPLNKKIYISTVIGFLLGMFFGERCANLEHINTLFIKIFQITIIPYMIFTLLQSLGSMSIDNAKRIAKRGGIMIFLLWAISIFFAFCLKYSFPDISKPRFFRPLSLPKNTAETLFDLFIPSNPFYSIANGYIPAIVIFCILVGVALIHESRKNIIVDLAEVCASIMKRVNNSIMILLPLGILIMSTYTFGTISFVKLKGVLLYILISLFYLVFISMAVYPGILSSFSRLSYRKFVHYSLPSAIIAFTTGSVSLALPVIYHQMQTFVKEERELLHNSYTKENDVDLLGILIPLAWIIPASYKFLVIVFLVFEQWYYGCQTNSFVELIYFIGGIPCLFGNNSVIVPFLLQVIDLPMEAYNIFMIVSSFLVYFNNANGAFFIVTVTIITYLSITGNLKLRLLKVITYLFICLFIFFGAIAGIRFFMHKVLSDDSSTREQLTKMESRGQIGSWFPEITPIYLNLDEYNYIQPLTPNEPLLDKIDRTDILQVGYNPDSAPLCFINARNELVGYDIDFIYFLAQQLGCDKIEFYPISNAIEYQRCIEEGKVIDICIGGYTYRSLSGDKVTSSDPYLKITPAIIIPEELKSIYPNYESVDHENTELRIGILYKTVLSPKIISEVEKNKPDKLVLLENIDDFYVEKKCDAMFIWGELGASINIIHPGYQIYYPTQYLKELEDFDVFLSYLVPYYNNSESFRSSVNSWITAWFRYGIQKKRYDYWILGQTNIKTVKPWSLLSYLEENNFFFGTETIPSTNN